MVPSHGTDPGSNPGGTTPFPSCWANRQGVFWPFVGCPGSCNAVQPVLAVQAGQDPRVVVVLPPRHVHRLVAVPVGYTGVVEAPVDEAGVDAPMAPRPIG